MPDSWMPKHPTYRLAVDKKLYQWLKQKAIETTTVVPKKEEDPLLDALMLTINPQPSIEFEEFIAKVQRFARRKTIQPMLWEYTFEQRRAKEPLEGIHVHMLLIGKPCEILKWARSSFKKMVGNPMNTNQINLKKVNFKRNQKYLRGMKQGKPKKNKSGDIILRKKYNLPDIFICE